MGEEQEKTEVRTEMKTEIKTEIKNEVKEKDTMATGTDTELEKEELTKLGKFCHRHGINSNLIMLKITLFVMYGGELRAVLNLARKRKTTTRTKLTGNLMMNAILHILQSFTFTVSHTLSYSNVSRRIQVAS